MIRGHKHLHECAFIGDDSSEEIDELMEAIREGNTLKDGTKSEPKTDDAPINRPNEMKRHRPDVKFHDPSHPITTHKNHTLDSQIADDPDEIDRKQMAILLAQLSEKTKKVKETWEEHIHTYRNQSVNEKEATNLKFANDALQRLRIRDRPKLNQTSGVPVPKILTSEEIFEQTLNLIETKGASGRKILERLIDKYNLTNNLKDKDTADLKLILDNAVLNHTMEKSMTNISAQNIPIKKQDVSKMAKNEKMEGILEKLVRKKRDIVLKLAKTLNEQDEEKDAAFEEVSFPINRNISVFSCAIGH